MSNPTFSGYTGTPWDGTPLADGAYIALQSTGYAMLDVMNNPDGSFHPLSSFIGTTPLAGSVFTRDRSMTATMDYLVAPLPASNVGSVFRVTTWPRVAGEQYGYASNYQKIILQGPSGKYLEIAQRGPSSGSNYSFSASQADARVFLLSPVGAHGVLFDVAYRYSQRASIESNFYANTSRGVYELTICQMPYAGLQSPLGQIIQGKTNSGSLNVFVMTPQIAPTVYDTRLDDPRVFDAAFYLKAYPDLTAAFGTNVAAAHEHWVTMGFAKEGRRGSRAFDAQFYLGHYPDLKAAFGSNYMAALTHWLSLGLPNEGRAGSADFDPQFYLAAYSDLKAAYGANYKVALDHWLTCGINEGRKGAA